MASALFFCKYFTEYAFLWSESNCENHQAVLGAVDYELVKPRLLKMDTCRQDYRSSKYLIGLQKHENDGSKNK